MKRWDKLSLRGVVMTVLGFMGMGYEWASPPPETFLLVMYGIVCIFGLLLVFWIKERE